MFYNIPEFKPTHLLRVSDGNLIEFFVDVMVFGDPNYHGIREAFASTDGDLNSNFPSFSTWLDLDKLDDGSYKAFRCFSYEHAIGATGRLDLTVVRTYSDPESDLLTTNSNAQLEVV